jgi:hypothetical protein
LQSKKLRKKRCPTQVMLKLPHRKQRRKLQLLHFIRGIVTHDVWVLPQRLGWHQARAQRHRQWLLLLLLLLLRQTMLRDFVLLSCT